MTCSKRKLTTPERKPPSNIQEVVVGKPFIVNNNFKTVRALDTPTVMMMTLARVNTNKHTIRNTE